MGLSKNEDVLTHQVVTQQQEMEAWKKIAREQERTIKKYKSALEQISNLKQKHKVLEGHPLNEAMNIADEAIDKLKLRVNDAVGV